MKRDSSLDIIRIVAIWIIVSFHFCIQTGLTNSPFCIYKNGDWGCVGTTMFFVLSGYVMRLCHKKIIRIKDYYMRRFLAIYPMFWLAFLIAYVIHSLSLDSFQYGGPLWKMIYSIIGIDNYLTFYQIPTYAVVGEWFTAVIAVIYILYPLLNYIFVRWMKIVTVVLAVLYFANIVCNKFVVPPDANLITGIFMFWIGMILEKYGTKIKEQRILLAPAFVIAFIIVYVKLPFFALPWKNLLGVSIFVLLLILCQGLEKITFAVKPVRFLSEISYGVYLCHHFIIVELVKRFNVFLVSDKIIALFYCFMLGIVLLVSAALYYVTGALVKKGKKRT